MKGVGHSLFRFLRWIEHTYFLVLLLCVRNKQKKKATFSLLKLSVLYVSGKVNHCRSPVTMVAGGGGQNHGLVVSDQIVRLKNVVFVVVRLDMRLCIFV